MHHRPGHSERSNGSPSPKAPVWTCDIEIGEDKCHVALLHVDYFPSKCLGLYRRRLNMCGKQIQKVAKMLEAKTCSWDLKCLWPRDILSDGCLECDKVLEIYFIALVFILPFLPYSYSPSESSYTEWLQDRAILSGTLTFTERWYWDVRQSTLGLWCVAPFMCLLEPVFGRCIFACRPE